jgi:hypothetical protein
MRLIKNGLVLMLGLTGIFMPTYAADIPNELFGYWMDESDNCVTAKKSLATTGMWAGILIRKQSIGFIESSCSASRVSKTGVGSYILQLKCAGEGEEWKVSTTYTVSGAQLQTVNDKGETARYRRCAN